MDEGRFTDRTPSRRGTRRQKVSERPNNRGALGLQPTYRQDDASGDGAARRGRGQAGDAREPRREKVLPRVVRSYSPIAMFPFLILTAGFIGEGMALGALLSGFVAGFCLMVGE